MNLDQQIRDLVSQAVREALDVELPRHLKKLVSVPDPDRTYTFARAAQYLGVTESCVRERVKAGELDTIQLGKYRLIPHRSIQQLVDRELDRQRFERDQVASILPADVGPEIEELLNPKATPRTGRVGNKKSGQRKR